MSHTVRDGPFVVTLDLIYTGITELEGDINVCVMGAVPPENGSMNAPLALLNGAAVDELQGRAQGAGVVLHSGADLDDGGEGASIAQLSAGAYRHNYPSSNLYKLQDPPPCDANDSQASNIAVTLMTHSDSLAKSLCDSSGNSATCLRARFMHRAVPLRVDLYDEETPLELGAPSYVQPSPDTMPHPLHAHALGPFTRSTATSGTGFDSACETNSTDGITSNSPRPSASKPSETSFTSNGETKPSTNKSASNSPRPSASKPLPHTLVVTLSLGQLLPPGEELEPGTLFLELWKGNVVTQSVAVLLVADDELEMSLELCDLGPLGLQEANMVNDSQWMYAFAKVGMWLQHRSGLRAEKALESLDFSHRSSMSFQLKCHMAALCSNLLEQAIAKGMLRTSDAVLHCLIHDCGLSFYSLLRSNWLTNQSLLHIAMMSQKAYMVKAVMDWRTRGNPSDAAARRQAPIRSYPMRRRVGVSIEARNPIRASRPEASPSPHLAKQARRGRRPPMRSNPARRATGDKPKRSQVQVLSDLDAS
eukprot:gene16443-22662_t